MLDGVSTPSSSDRTSRGLYLAGVDRIRAAARPVLSTMVTARSRPRLVGAWVVLCVVLAVLAVLSNELRQGRLAPAVALVAALLGSAPLLTAPRWPATSLSLVLLGNGIFLLFARLSWPPTNMIAGVIAVAACPILLSRTQAVALLVLIEVGVVSAVFIPARINATPWDGSLIEALVAALAWGVGQSLRMRRIAALEHAETESRVQALRERDAVAQGRVSIARELHDVVAHHVSMIAVQAGAAPYAMADLPPAAEQAFKEIADQARTALTELRTVLGVLRTPDVAAAQAPQPGLADLNVLLDRMRASGATIHAQVRGAPRRLPDAVELCGYRIVQEALTNVGRHAPGSAIEVDLAYEHDALTVAVTDDGAGSLNRSKPGERRGVPQHSSESTEAGFGLVGMRERVTMLGGQLRAGPTPDAAGFCVLATLPVAASTDASRNGGD
jgi:signal transduction histidine kinase